jgi:hypothetical protein
MTTLSEPIGGVFNTHDRPPSWVTKTFEICPEELYVTAHPESPYIQSVESAGAVKRVGVGEANRWGRSWQPSVKEIVKSPTDNVAKPLVNRRRTLSLTDHCTSTRAILVK